MTQILLCGKIDYSSSLFGFCVHFCAKKTLYEICQNEKGPKAMTEAVGSKPLVDQIIDAWFAGLEDTNEFDASTIESLKHLASSGTLKKPAQVKKAILVVSGDAK